MPTSDPILPTTALIPLGVSGGARPVDDAPARLRPFVATLAVPRRIDNKKHDTNATTTTYRTNSETINDGTRVTDSTVDTTVDD